MAYGLILAAYLAVGCFVAYAFFEERGTLWRVWFGCAAGFLLFMWLPALFAFPLGFTMAAQWAALASLAAIGAACVPAWVKRLRARDVTAICSKGEQSGDERLIKPFIILVPALTLLAGYLQYTHTLRPVGDALHTGQSTYGDLSLHLSIATSLRNAPFPPEYALLPGTRLAYPFLMDTLSTSLMLWGMPLRWSFIVPGTIMCAHVFMGILLLSYQITRCVKASMASLMLMVFCGGFGFLYVIDMAGADPSRFLEVFTGFYRAPANMTDVNVRWSNLLTDIWLPQRTLLGGWVILLPALSLVLELPHTQRTWRTAIAAALFAGGLPLIHTHSFLALGLFSAGYLGYINISTMVADRKVRLTSRLTSTLLFLIITVGLSLPQLITFTFAQASADGFLRFQFNWVNSASGTLKDLYLFFWIKNVGPPMLLILPAIFNLKGHERPIAAGAFTIFIAAEFIAFQPNTYDNNKLFYVWYLMMLPIACVFGVRLYKMMSGVKLRSLAAAAFLLISMISGILSVAREAVSDYVLYSENAMPMTRYVEDNTPANAVILTATNHNNPISAVAGRKVVCGPDLFLFFHGLSYTEKMADVLRFYTNPAESGYVIEDNDVSYILVGEYERSITGMDENAIAALYPLAFEASGYRLYKVGDLTRIVEDTAEHPDG